MPARQQEEAFPPSLTPYASYPNSSQQLPSHITPAMVAFVAENTDHARRRHSQR